MPDRLSEREPVINKMKNKNRKLDFSKNDYNKKADWIMEISDDPCYQDYLESKEYDREIT